MCEFAALGALCAPGATIQILQLHLGSYAKLAAILNELPDKLGNVFKVINTVPLYHICIATAESPFFLFSKSMPVAQIKKWDVAFGALLVALGYLTVTPASCTIFQTLLDVDSPENKAARLVFAAAARVRGLLQVQNGTGLWNVFHATLVAAGVINWGAINGPLTVKNSTGLFNVFHPILVAAGVINWGAINGPINGPLTVKNSTGLFNVFHPILVAAGAINWGEIQGRRNVKESTGLFAPENQAKVRAGQRKGGNTKMGEGKTKVS